MKTISDVKIKELDSLMFNSIDGMNNIMKYIRRFQILIKASLLTLSSIILCQCASKTTDQISIIERDSLFISEDNEFATTFNKSMDTVYFIRAAGRWGKDQLKGTIYMSVKSEEGWIEPKQVSFSGAYDDSDPHLNQDGEVLFFTSNRPPSKSSDIWFVEKMSNGKWSEPERLENVNSEFSEYSPTTDDLGNLYFASDRPGGIGQGDFYKAEYQNGVYLAPINMGSVVNSAFGEWNLHIANDTILIFESSGRESNKSGYGDIFISFYHNNGWVFPQNIQEINTSGSDLYPFYSSNSQRLFYTSSDSLSSTNTNIYSINFSKIIDKYYRSTTIENSKALDD